MNPERKAIHRHHIIPLHAGGTDESLNIEYLTIPEHAEAHRILFETHGRWQDKIAWQGLAGILMGDEAYLAAVGWMKGRPAHPNVLAAFKRPKTKEHVYKIFRTRKLNGFSQSLESREKISNTRQKRKHLYKPKSKEHIEKIRAFSSKPKSELTRKRMSDHKKIYWEQIRQKKRLEMSKPYLEYCVWI